MLTSIFQRDTEVRRRDACLGRLATAPGVSIKTGSHGMRHALRQAGFTPEAL